MNGSVFLSVCESALEEKSFEDSFLDGERAFKRLPLLETDLNELDELWTVMNLFIVWFKMDKDLIATLGWFE